VAKSKAKLKAVSSVVEAEPLKIDLGCGQNKKPGFTGIDIAAAPGVDIVHDLMVMPWPFKNDSVGEVFSSHTIEHFTGPQRVKFMEELWRVMQVGANATFVFPYYSSSRAIQDPFHAWPPLCEASFLYFNKGWMIANKLDHYNIKCDFDFTYGYAFSGQLVNRPQEMRDFAIRNYINAVDDLHVTLTKRAG